MVSLVKSFQAVLQTIRPPSFILLVKSLRTYFLSLPLFPSPTHRHHRQHFCLMGTLAEPKLTIRESGKVCEVEAVVVVEVVVVKDTVVALLIIR